MKNKINYIMLTLKGKLGFCQSKGCWKRSIYELTIPCIKTKRNFCKAHKQEICKNGTLKNIINIIIEK